MTTDRELLASALLARATWAHDRMRLGDRFNVPIHEPTLTQEILLDLRLALPSLVVHAFSQTEEGKNGADWEWWWQGAQRWFGARVQAKRLVPQAGGRWGYGLLYPHDSSKVLQVDRLLSASKAADLPALYVLYNGPGLDLGLFSWRCRRLAAIPGTIGVAAIPADVVRYLVAMGWTDQEAVLDRALPWSCLAMCLPSCCPSIIPPAEWFNFPPGTPADDLAFGMVWSIIYMRELSLRGQFRQRSAQPPLDTSDLVVGVREEPPPYVLAALTNELGDEGPEGVDYLLISPRTDG